MGEPINLMIGIIIIIIICIPIKFPSSVSASYGIHNHLAFFSFTID